MKSYGVLNRDEPLDATLSLHLEELERLGFTVLPGVLNQSEIEEYCGRLDEVYARQVQESGEELLASTRELDLARCPLLYDEQFLKLATHPRIHSLVRAVLGPRFLLHLQNGIINRPTREHHQSSWHRDLPYQEWTCSKPLALGCLVCLLDFNQETGGTLVLPGSHLSERMPSQEYIQRHEQQACAPAGSVIVFNAMLYHRAGVNRSSHVRRGVNHVFCTEILKQQIDLPRALGGRYSDDPELAILLGYASSPAESVVDYRSRRARRVPSS